LADLLDAVATRAERVYLVGDLNIRLDRADDANVVRLVDLFGGYGLNIQVSVPTHQLGGLLDVAATCRDLAAPEVKVVDVGLSDHYLLQWSVSLACVTPVTETVVRRPWRSLDIVDFWSALSLSVLCQPNCWLGLDVDTMASLYDTELTVVLDRVVPACTVNRQPRPSDLWFDAECRATKRLTRRLERAAIVAAKKPDAAVAANASQTASI